MNPREIKRRANAIRKCRTGEAYYDRKYKDLRVADLLLVLEGDNYHSEETILEALATLNYYTIIEACKLEIERDIVSDMDYEDDNRAIRAEELHERQKELNDKIRGVQTIDKTMLV